MKSVRLGNRKPRAQPLTKKAARIHQAEVPGEISSTISVPAASNRPPNTISRCGSVCLGKRRPLTMLPTEIAATSGVSSRPASLGV
ncbi:hypothetical protein G6F35_018939 [Rhizopus arrhizus]|nr:hypothetical protein G6F35_018939 [Rhizopus arrhizus]